MNRLQVHMRLIPAVIKAEHILNHSIHQKQAKDKSMGHPCPWERDGAVNFRGRLLYTG